MVKSFSSGLHDEFKSIFRILFVENIKRLNSNVLRTIDGKRISRLPILFAGTNIRPRNRALTKETFRLVHDLVGTFSEKGTAQFWAKSAPQRILSRPIVPEESWQVYKRTRSRAIKILFGLPGVLITTTRYTFGLLAPKLYSKSNAAFLKITIIIHGCRFSRKEFLLHFLRSSIFFFFFCNF